MAEGTNQSVLVFNALKARERDLGLALVVHWRQRHDGFKCLLDLLSQPLLHERLLLVELELLDLGHGLVE